MKKENRALAAIEGLWRALWNSPPPGEVVEALKRRQAVRVKRLNSQHSVQEVVVEIGTWGKERCLHLRADRTLKEFCFVAMGQEVLLEIPPGSLIAKWERVFLEARSLSKLEEVLEVVRLLGLLLFSMGLGDLEEAVETLASIEDGEARTKGSYALIRKGNLWVLGREGFFGDPTLSCKFMKGDEVTFRYPGGVAISLKGDLTGGWVRIREGYIRWGNEASQLYCTGASHLVNEGGFRELLRCGLLEALNRTNSLRMRTLIEALLEKGDPIEALKEEGFIERVKMDILAKF
jgi:hypothetical protein